MMEQKLLLAVPATASKDIDEEYQKKIKKENDAFFNMQKALLNIALAQEEHERLSSAAKNQKNGIEKKTESSKKQKDITLVIDDEESKEKLKDQFKDNLLTITIDMLGFERFHLEQYQQQLANYSRFLAEYLEGERTISKKQQQSYTYTSQRQEQQEPTEVQMLTYHEQQDYVRSTVMNDLLGNSGSNYIDPNTKDSWMLWRIFQYNQIMSFLYTSQWRH